MQVGESPKNDEASVERQEIGTHDPSNHIIKSVENQSDRQIVQGGIHQGTHLTLTAVALISLGSVQAVAPTIERCGTDFRPDPDKKYYSMNNLIRTSAPQCVKTIGRRSTDARKTPVGRTVTVTPKFTMVFIITALSKILEISTHAGRIMTIPNNPSGEELSGVVEAPRSLETNRR
ncbi:hypothetical protein H4Q26_010522 [Puccinia striiformis f. sp. tritici PST-130]|nr:hypothetical protein H4Q26_010522 [Puccinia striiformis f. sp. tritici PST-130]